MSIMIKISILISAIVILLNYIITHKKTYPLALTNISDEGERKSQYECGIEPLEEELGIETRERFFVKFYIIGILFLIFDLESILLYPITIIFYDNIIQGNIGGIIERSYIVFLLFIFLLLLGIFYEYRKKVL